MKQSPFKFLDPYQKKDKAIFFGREKEIELLYEMTFKTNLLLIYGQSGTGKTSLIQCGLANRFRESDWFDIYIRRGDNINMSLQEEIANKAETPIEPEASVAEGIQSLYLDYLKPVYLIFDQFEELFILGANPERQEFFETIKQLLSTLGRDGLKGVPCKILFIMREEYIARLYDFEKVVPSLFNFRFRVEPMHLSEVEAVIGSSCDAFKISFVEREKTIKGIVVNNREKHGIIGLPYLQVYLDRLYREAEKTDGIVFTPDGVDRIGKISDVMGAFLDEQTEGVQKKLKEKYRYVPEACVWQVLNCFVSVEGTNLPLEKEILYRRFQINKGIINDCLLCLEKSRILRLSEDQKTYEIAHDALALRIDNKRSIEEKTVLDVERLVKGRFISYTNTNELLAKGDLNYIEPYEKKLKSRLEEEEIDFIKKSRRHASKRKRNIIIGTVGVFVILLLAVFSGWQWKVAIESKKLALEKTKEAIVNKELAEKKGKEANARRLAVIADLVVKENPTIALGIAEKAWQLDKNDAVKATIYKIYGENSFYKTIAKCRDRVHSVAFSPNCKTILVGSEYHSVFLYDLNGKVVQEFKGHNNLVTSVAFSPNGNNIVTGSWDNTARLFDLQGNIVQEFEGHTASVSSVAFSPDGKTILTGSLDNTARLWDMHGKTIMEFKIESIEHFQNAVKSVAFSPDSKKILIGTSEGIVYLWDIHGNLIQEFKGHTESIYSVFFSPNGKTILTGSMDDTARLWDLKGNTITAFKGNRNMSVICSVAFSPDGNTILTGSWDNTARFWDIQGNILREEFKDPNSSIFSVAFSWDGNNILTGSGDGTVRLWNVSYMPLEEFLEKGNFEKLTPEQMREYGIEE